MNAVTKVKVLVVVAILVSLVSVWALARPSTPEVSRLELSRTGGWLTFQNLGTTDYVIFVRYSTGADERIVLEPGETYILRNRPDPVEISAGSS